MKNLSKIALIALFSLFVFASCEKEEPTPPGPFPPSTLEAPKNIVFDSKTLTFTWDKVTNATGYQCAIDNILAITVAKVIKNNGAVLENPVKDEWHTFYVRAVNGSVSSEIVPYQYIVTDKMLLDTPTNLAYNVLERVDGKLKVKFSCAPVSNAAKYKFNCVAQFDGGSVAHGGTVDVPEFTVPSIKSGATITLSVSAIPAEGSSEYAISKVAVAQVQNLK